MRCFIAIDINDELQKRLALLVHSLNQTNDKCIRTVNDFHITLAFLGETDEEKLESIKKGMSEISIAPFEIELKSAGVFENKGKIRTIWIACRGVPRPLIDVLDAITGEQRHKPLQAHITLARAKCKPNAAVMAWLLDHKDAFAGKQKVEKIALKESILMPDGAVHRIIYERNLT